MRITVIIPTYRRPTDLLRCLEALKQQTRPADEVIVVVRDIDSDTRSFLEQFDSGLLPLRTEQVTVTGVVAAMNLGLEAAQGDIVAFTDDDAAPHAEWLARIEAHFQSSDRIGGVGGRDYVYHGTELEDGAAAVVGRVNWFGRLVGNHHIGVGDAREVDLLKGVNMSFRRAAIGPLRFDSRMRGTGAQVHFEVIFCFRLRQQGWTLIYDPKVAVDHYPARRFDEDQRKSFSDAALTNAVHNETLILLEHLPPTQRLAFLMWSFLIGTKQAFGLIQWLRFLPREGALAGQKLLASLQGRWQGWQTWQRRSAA